jgi:hypothetical protein
MMVIAALSLGSGTAAAVTFLAPVAPGAGSIAASPETPLPYSQLSDAPSMEVALLGGEPGDDALFEAAVAADEASSLAAYASADSLTDFASEGDAYSWMASTRGFESSGHGRAWGGSLLAAGVTAAIVAESSRHTTRGFEFGGPASHNPGTPSSAPSLDSDETPGNDVPEPGTFALLAAGMISAAFRRRQTRA